MSHQENNPPSDGAELSDEQLDFVVGGRETWFLQPVDREAILSSLDQLENTPAAPGTS